MIKIALKILFLTFSSILLIGCTALAAPKPSFLSNKDYSSVSSIKVWNLNGLIAIHHQSNAWSASLNWQQQNQYYHITLFGPLGTHSYDLQGQPGFVLLRASNGKSVSAGNPESLLYAQTGAEIPVSHLFYWVRGLPVPGLSKQAKWDANHHLLFLNQDGWNIRYLHYISVNKMDVPDKLFLNSQNLQVKLLINRWQF